jgi:alkanesulfonate monooxygenase SsuD/methylene tetrahydromethanopterin reductase-like flavin-dependent oxidoreductase (luciferase family)
MNVAQPKVILQIYPMLPTTDRTERELRRPLGRDAELYHHVLHEWLDIVKAADELGVWGISTIEHHLHSEGYEVGPTPGVLNAWWSSHVKQAHIGSLGYVMATQDPIRVAEETAILDHITGGRFFVGLARGYQSRWANILGQFTDAPATVSDGSSEDERNRRIFEERVEMLLRCWRDDSIDFDGEFYKAPYPFDTGVVDYPASWSAKHAGAEGEVDDDGHVRRIAVCPKPYTKPHPPIFVAIASSPDSIRFAARNGFRPVYFTKLSKIEELAQLYVETAADAGLDFALGERQVIVRWPHFAKSEDEYDQKLTRYDLDIYKNFYVPFFPQFPGSPDDPEFSWTNNMRESGIFIGGTVEAARKEWIEMYEKVPAEFVCLIWHYAQIPKDDLLWELETFMTQVLPDLESVEPASKTLVGGRA